MLLRPELLTSPEISRAQNGSWKPTIRRRSLSPLFAETPETLVPHVGDGERDYLMLESVLESMELFGGKVYCILIRVIS